MKPEPKEESRTQRRQNLGIFEPVNSTMAKNFYITGNSNSYLLSLCELACVQYSHPLKKAFLEVVVPEDVQS